MSDIVAGIEQYIHCNAIHSLQHKVKIDTTLNFTKCEIYLNEQARKNKLDRRVVHPTNTNKKQMNYFGRQQ